MVLAALACGVARGQAPSYSADGIVNAADYSTGFSPNSLVSLFGSKLSYVTQGITQNDVAAGRLPTVMGYVRVYVDNSPAPLFYVSDTQINFLVPSDQIAGAVKVRVVREGVTGPEVTLTLADVAPALFDSGGGWAVATHADNTLVTRDSPAQGDEIIVIYITGLGKTQPNPASGEIPQYPGQISRLKELKVTLDGVAADASRILYAGLTPGCVGLYQINIALPPDVGADPQMQVAIADRSSQPGFKLAVAQLNPSRPR